MEKKKNKIILLKFLLKISLIFLLLYFMYSSSFVFSYDNYQIINSGYFHRKSFTFYDINLSYINNQSDLHLEHFNYISFENQESEIEINYKFNDSKLKELINTSIQYNHINYNENYKIQYYYLINGIICKEKCYVKNPNIEICQINEKMNFKNCYNYSFQNNINNINNNNTNNSINNIREIELILDEESGLKVIYVFDNDISNKIKNRYIYLNNANENYIINGYIDSNGSIYEENNENVEINKRIENGFILNQSESTIIREENDLLIRENFSMCGVLDIDSIIDLNIDLNNLFLIDKNNCVISNRDSLFTINKDNFNEMFYSLNTLNYEKIDFSKKSNFVLRIDDMYYIFYNETKDITNMYLMSLSLQNKELFYFDDIYSYEKKEIYFEDCFGNCNHDSDYNNNYNGNNENNFYRYNYEIDYLLENNIIGIDKIAIVFFTPLDKFLDQERYLESLKLKYKKIYVVNLWDYSNYDLFFLKDKMEKSIKNVFQNEERLDTIVLFNYASKIFYERDWSDIIHLNTTKIILKGSIFQFNMETSLNKYLLNNKKKILDYLKYNDKISLNKLFVMSFKKEEIFESTFFYQVNKNNKNVLSKNFLKYIISKLEDDEYEINYRNNNTAVIYNSLLVKQDTVSHSDDIIFFAISELGNASYIKQKSCLYYSFKNLNMFDNNFLDGLLNYVLCDSYDSLLETIIWM